MAYTKVFAIRARLDDRVKYAVNGEKTELDERIVYTADPEKTDTVRFVTTLNCRPAETAFAAMQKTKKKYKKTGGVLGYHLRRWTKGYTIKQPNMDCQPTEITALMRHRAVFS